MLDGELAWRQHDGGHTDGPNWKYFIPWADKFLGYKALASRFMKVRLFSYRHSQGQDYSCPCIVGRRLQLQRINL